MNDSRLRWAALAASALLTTTLAACGDDPSAPDSSSAAQDDTSASEASLVSIEDPWVKAADSGMTAAFGTLKNSGDQDVVVTAVSSDITSMMELHETVENADGSMAMQPKDGGFVVAAGGEHELAPGGDHLMIMDLSRPIEPGESVTFTLTMEDGSTTDFTAVVKSFTGADEEYQGGMG